MNQNVATSSGMPQVVLIVIGVIVVILLGIAAYYIVRYMRGSIKVFLPKTAFNPGETIAGRFEIRTKTTVQGNRLIAMLVGMEVTRERRNGKTHTRSREIYRDERIIEETRVYRIGHFETHEFELVAPNINDREFSNSPLGGVLKGAVELLSNRRTNIKWRVEVRLDAKGVDLADRKAVFINLE